MTLRVADMVVDELDGVELARRPVLRSTSAAPAPRVEVRAQRCRTATLPGAGCGVGSIAQRLLGAGGASGRATCTWIQRLQVVWRS